MSKVIKKRSKIRQYWKKLMDSPHNKLSRGSTNICRIIPWARGENWRHSDRKQRKRQFRSLWIVRINAAARQNGLTYGRFMNGLKKASIVELLLKTIPENNFKSTFCNNLGFVL